MTEDALSIHCVHAFWVELEKLAADDAVNKLYARAVATQKKMRPVQNREARKLSKQFGVRFHGFGSVNSGINLPDEGASDIDLNVGVRDPDAFSEVLARAGIPLKDKKHNSRQQILHEYKSPEGYDVEIKIRPEHEIAWQMPGRRRITRLSKAQKAAIVAEKYRLKESGDKDAYNAYKWSTYEKYKMIPPGGDWDLVKKAFAEELKKIAAFAPGLPDKRKTSPIPKVEKPRKAELVLQSHPAARAGQHVDVRLIMGNIAHSWATKKPWPGPGERIRLYQQPDHTPAYARHFQGHLASGYGRTKPESKGVQKTMHEKIEVMRTTDRLVRFNVGKGDDLQKFVLVKLKEREGEKPKAHPTWTLINVTKLVEKTAAKLTAETRDALATKAFALPGRRYPVHDVSHARAALSMVAKHGTPAEQARVRAVVSRRYPGIGTSR